ncbi:MAG TPA: M48 family metallopeptidase [Gemmatimonadaceae bacterium]|nr:M48 family metallopeptidase [Gemmatimonadaceae bacterium]
MRRTLTAAALSVGLMLGTGACAVSQQQEIEMGQQYAQQINAQLPIISDPEINRYINVLGDSIAHLTARGDLDWHFYVVDSKEVNAFAVPGGFVYVNRGLIERTTEMDQLAGVLGHEIGHVVRRHSVKQMQQQQKANIGVTLACVLTRVCDNQAAGTLINVAGGAVFAKFSRQDEAEADAEGIKNTVRAGISPQGIPEMFQILLDERKTRPAGVDAWFQTHPLEEDRIAATESEIKKYDPAVLRSLSHDSQNFHRFKDRIASLPPSPVTSGSR